MCSVTTELRDGEGRKQQGKDKSQQAYQVGILGAGCLAMHPGTAFTPRPWNSVLLYTSIPSHELLNLPLPTS